MKLYENIDKKLKKIKALPEFKEYLESLQECFEEDYGKEVMHIDYSIFNQFFETGSRKGHADRYWYTRRRLTCGAILYLLYKEEKYLIEVCNMVWHICSEVTWALSAHLDGRPVKNYRTEIDLMAAETAAELAEIYHLLQNDLPDKITALIKCEIEGRIFNGFEGRTFWWETVKNNWAAVCGNGVGIAYMLIDPERFENVRDRLLSAMDSFLSSYGEDGCCQEGVGYWNYGFGSFLYFSHFLYDFTDGKYDIRHSEKIDKIATYIQNVMLRENIPVSFSDASRKLEFFNVGILSYLYENYDGFSVPDFTVGVFEKGEARFFRTLRKLLWYNPEIKEKITHVKLGWNYLEDAQWYVNRKEKYSFGAKSGHNDEPHNHNDIGSFVFATDKGQILADIGAMEYTKDNFSDKRYDFLQNSSLGHSVPIIDNTVQLKGREHCGKVLRYNEKEFALEIQDAYGCNLPKVVREFTMGDEGVVLKDTFEDAQGRNITERFISMIEPQITEEGVVIADTVITADKKPTITSQVIMNRQVQPETVYIIDYPHKGNEFVLKMSVK